jgi:hypothetical protein
MKKKDEFSEYPYEDQLLLLNPMRDKLYEAIDKGWGDKIKELVEEYGENSLHKYNGWSPLHHATQSKCFNLDIIKYLIEKCPYAVNFQDNASCTPFHNAVKLAASKSKSEDIEIQQQTVEAVKYMRPYASTETIIDNTLPPDATFITPKLWYYTKSQSSI